MRVEGDAEDLYHILFEHGLVPQILLLLVETWAVFIRPTQDESEPKITNRFVKALQTECRKRKAKFRVVPHALDLTDLDPDGKGYAEIDICIHDGFEPDCYFGIEAKKLHTTSASGKWESNAGEYAGIEGMGCFTSGRYAARQNEGAMLAYVMDGDCQTAVANIVYAIEQRAESLGVDVPCEPRPAADLPHYPEAFETHHSLDRGTFKIHHILVAA